MNTTAFRLPASALVLLVSLGLPAAQASADGDGDRTRTSTAADAAGSERAPAAAPSAAQPETASPSSRPTADPAAPVTANVVVEPAPAAVDASPAPSPSAQAPNMEQLAADAAALPAPVTDDFSLASLDAVLSDETADPISGVPDEPLVSENQGVPEREDVQRAIDLVIPSIRACVSGQSGRVVSVSEVFDSTGRVRSARVDVRTAHFRPSQRSCMARAARDARLPAFEMDTFEVTFPVRL